MEHKDFFEDFYNDVGDNAIGGGYNRYDFLDVRLLFGNYSSYDVLTATFDIIDDGDDKEEMALALQKGIEEGKIDFTNIPSKYDQEETFVALAVRRVKRDWSDDFDIEFYMTWLSKEGLRAYWESYEEQRAERLKELLTELSELGFELEFSKDWESTNHAKVGLVTAVLEEIKRLGMSFVLNWLDMAKKYGTHSKTLYVFPTVDLDGWDSPEIELKEPFNIEVLDDVPEIELGIDEFVKSPLAALLKEKNTNETNI